MNMTKSSSLRSMYSIFRSLLKHRVMCFGTSIVCVVILMAVFAPILAPYDPYATFWGKEYTPPNSRFLLGTDELGRDVLSRLMWGARTSLRVGLLSTLIATIFGVLLGCISGYYSGVIDNLIMRVTDVVMTFPFFF